MKIGVVSGCDISAFVDYFEAADREILNQNCYPSSAPAINTLLLSFLKSGHSLRVFTVAKNDIKLSGRNIDIIGVQSYNRYPIKYLWGDFMLARRIAKAVQCNLNELEVLHAHWTYFYAYAVKGLSHKLPVYCTVRDWASYIWQIESLKNKISWTFKCLMNELVMRDKTIQFVANSPYTAARIKKKYKLPVPVIPNPIKESFLTDKERITPSGLELLCISTSNDKRKNIDTLLKAFQLVLQKYPTARLSLIGRPFTNSSPKVKAWKNNGWLQGVSLLGAVDHDSLTHYLDYSRIFVTPSLEETFGNTLLEAMSRKVPVVAGENSGAIPYVLEHGKAGFLCAVSDAVQLSRTIIHVYDHRMKAEAKAMYAFNYLKENYLDSEVCNSHIELYKTKINSVTN